MYLVIYRLVMSWLLVLHYQTIYMYCHLSVCIFVLVDFGHMVVSLWFIGVHLGILLDCLPICFRSFPFMLRFLLHIIPLISLWIRLFFLLLSVFTLFFILIFKILCLTFHLLPGLFLLLFSSLLLWRHLMWFIYTFFIYHPVFFS